MGEPTWGRTKEGQWEEAETSEGKAPCALATRSGSRCGSHGPEDWLPTTPGGVLPQKGSIHARII